MSCLKHSFRISDSSLFQNIYKNGKQYHRPSFVIFYLKSPKDEVNLAFVSSKKVGNAVKRNRSRRVLRSIAGNFCENIKSGLYIIVAKEVLHRTPQNELLSDFERGLKYLRVLRLKNI